MHRRRSRGVGLVARLALVVHFGLDFGIKIVTARLHLFGRVRLRSLLESSFVLGSKFPSEGFITGGRILAARGVEFRVVARREGMGDVFVVVLGQPRHEVLGCFGGGFPIELPRIPRRLQNGCIQFGFLVVDFTVDVVVVVACAFVLVLFLIGRRGVLRGFRITPIAPQYFQRSVLRRFL